MNAKMKLAALSVSVVAALAAAPAHAYVYADAALEIRNLSIVFGGGITGGSVTQFTFNTSDSASLNGVGAQSNVACQGVNPSSGGATNCNRTNPAQPVLFAPAANAPGGSAAAIRANNDFTFKGPAGGNQFSNSAATIFTSELFTPIVAGPPVSGGTNTNQIAESQLQANGAADANSKINSTTTLGLTFAVTGSGNVTISFSANPDLLAMIQEGGNNGLFLADASTQTSFSIQGNGQRATWSPDGLLQTGNAACQNVVGLTCNEFADSQNLNDESFLLLSTGNVMDARSHNGIAFTPFGLTISGLSSGTYTLQLTAQTQTNIQRTVIPEPASVALMGVGLLGLALARKRRAGTKA